jgi:hypothetical protein
MIDYVSIINHRATNIYFFQYLKSTLMKILGSVGYKKGYIYTYTSKTPIIVVIKHTALCIMI